MLIHQYKNKIEYVADHLRKLIGSGALPAGARLKSSAELAAELNVSPMTADRAIRQLTAEGILKRVTGSGTFVLERGKTINICIVDSKKFHSVLERDILYNKNTFPLLEKEFSRRNARFQYVKSWGLLKNLKPDGILSATPPPEGMHLTVPAAIYRNYKLFEGPYIQSVPDLKEVMHDICSRLVQKKVRRICVFATPHPPINYFAKTFMEYCRLYDLHKIIEYCEKSTHKYLPPSNLGFEYAMQLPLERNTAIFTTSDFRASGILKAFDERSFPPGDYDLISCNNWEAYGYLPFDTPRITSIDFRREECLCDVVCQLCRAVRDPANDRISVSKYPALLKIRESGLQK